MAGEESKPFRILGAIKAAGNLQLEEEVRVAFTPRLGYEGVSEVARQVLVDAAYKVVYDGGENIDKEAIRQRIIEASDHELK